MGKPRGLTGLCCAAHTLPEGLSMPRTGRIRSTLRSARKGPTPRLVPRTAGVMLIRDALDIAPLVIGHHLAAGLERIHVIDDGSTDGTSEFLDDLAARSGRVSHHRVVTDHDPQAETVSDASNRLIKEGARLIMPFDADEFWDVNPDLLRAWVSDERPRQLTAQWLNFAQTRDHTYPRPRGLLAVRHHAAIDVDATEEAVSAFEASFLHYGPIPKVMVWSREPITFARGQHAVVLADGSTGLAEEAAEVDVMHVPLRWKSELTKRAFNYEPRRARQRAHPGDSWQSLFHLSVMHEQRDHDVWAANSVDEDGCLDVYGRRVPLTRDDRLHHALVRAGAQLLRMGIPVP